MDWKRLLKELNAAGVTQPRIAEFCGVGQSTVSELARGVTKSPSYDFGSKLVQMHGTHCPPVAASGQANPQVEPQGAD